MFYRGGDNGLWTRWLDSGTWSDEASLGGTLTTQPVAAMIPGTDTLQLFYRGADNALWTRWSDPGAYWSGEHSLQGFLNGDPVAAVIPGTDILHLFYRGGDGALWTRYRDPGGNFWSAEENLGGALNGDPVAAPIPGTGILQLFYRGTDNALWTVWRDPAANPPWSVPDNKGGVLTSNPAVAQIPGTNILQLFYRGADNALWTRWLDSGTWSDEHRLGGVLNGDPVAVAIPGTDIVQVFYRGADNALWTRWRNPGPTPSWSDEQSRHGFLSGDPVAAVIPGTDILQVFYRGGDGALWTQWLDSGTWSAEQSLGGGLNGDPVAAAPAVAVSPVNWMTQLPGTSKLSQLTLPGTHETCTAPVTDAAKCQNWNLATQLQYGIRYVDIRCRHIQDVFAIHHESISVGFDFGEGVRDKCVDFLKANPTECIVMQVKHEYTDADNNLTFQQVFDKYVQGFEDFFYLDDHIPILGEVRGKIVVIRRFDVDSNDTVRGLTPLTAMCGNNTFGWCDNATFDASYTATNGEAVTFNIQDQYNLAGGDISPKWNAINSLLGQADADASDAWYINFTSASTSTATIYPDYYSGKINPLLSNYLSFAPFNARLGTLMMDFPDANMIGSIISLNTNK
jgi:1-phosphatidylinositol phosphodiesterase